MPGEIVADTQAGNRRDLDYALLDTETDIILPRDGLDEDDEMILVVDSSSEMPGRTQLDYGNRPAESTAGDLASKSSVNRESPPIRNIVLSKPPKLNESLECDDEDSDDCAINKFSLEGNTLNNMSNNI